MCSSSLRIVSFACAFGVLTILLTLSIISGLYLFVLSWSEFCQSVPTTCEECETLSTNCDYLIASTSLLSAQSALIILCFYTIICFYVTIKRNTTDILEPEPSVELPTPFIMADTSRNPVCTPHILPEYSEALSDRECLIRPRQPPNYADIN
ncbi:hypothetical protein LOD99_14855 [Oopsacas minuta]|uniref:Uncharacterized protein n=1 Tax=Oopsacas minuta TaxID=111878 RepID=A0AAV7KCK2_9METZ|nr:hypothetical protein LOD99_14855 [Oopsacas minuta]